MTGLVKAIIGAQYPSKEAFDENRSGFETLKKYISDADKDVQPPHWELASVTDKRGYYNIVVLSYWPSNETFDHWKDESGFNTWWESLNPEDTEHGCGFFLEVLTPTLDRFETVFSNNEVPEGAANMREKISGEMAEHAYWGSMRDRLALAQIDNLEGKKWITSPMESDLPTSNEQDDAKKKRIKVEPKHNLCIIRSGQDWSATLPSERDLYLSTMHPVLITGMTFLRDHGAEVGCYSMSLMDVLDPSTYESNQERTFGLGYFDDIANLEYWSKSHQTHIDIFGGFLKYAKKLDNVLSLRLFHEIFVLERGMQRFEYVGCHGETGMLNSLRG
ncbi:aldoxime dehydratase [Lophiotrema nucula]|uniref:Aldoxime dehydratase n=1 Tax=Lophiotrema nucula TaxID=690887 RepID=A0A6A5ZR74_9PLEO|nr:aldoxime dehydratase [Lophiotrema nucula]